MANNPLYFLTLTLVTLLTFFKEGREGTGRDSLLGSHRKTCGISLRRGFDGHPKRTRHPDRITGDGDGGVHKDGIGT